MPRDRGADRHAPFSQKTAPLDHDVRGGRWPLEVARLEVSTKACSNAAGGGSDGRIYDFPAERWDHLRTSNPIESVFATVRHRTVRTRGSLSSTTAKLMVFKLVMAASKTWRRLQGQNQLPKVIEASSNRAA